MLFKLFLSLFLRNLVTGFAIDLIEDISNDLAAVLKAAYTAHLIANFAMAIVNAFDVKSNSSNRTSLSIYDLRYPRT